jgi:hydrogenase maturation protease
MSGRATLVLGLGNVLLGDEGVGVRVLERLLDDRAAGLLDAPAELVDGGTLGLELLPLLDDAESVVMIDAIDLGLRPGAVVVLRDAELTARLGGAISVHQLGVGDLLAVARLRGTMPARASLVGVQPERLEVGLELSDAVAAAVPEAARLARREIVAMMGAVNA